MSGQPKDEAQAQRVAALIRRMEEAGATIEQRMPKPLAEMTFEERTAWLEREGVRNLTPAEVAEYYGDEGVANITFLGASRPTLRRGSVVRVQEANDSWRNQMVAVAAADGLVYVSEEAEWNAAQAEGREPHTTAHPRERVALADSEQ
ncbi:MAG: hypothetical protein DLM69_09475 [Candidatus Chloroheliales bacterium]|nr:MAG: hypothetical protein DLM69_09475 [Chloroflexota bacterium]